MILWKQQVVCVIVFGILEQLLCCWPLAYILVIATIMTMFEVYVWAEYFMLDIELVFEQRMCIWEHIMILWASWVRIAVFIWAHVWLFWRSRCLRVHILSAYQVGIMFCILWIWCFSTIHWKFKHNWLKIVKKECTGIYSSKLLYIEHNHVEFPIFRKLSYPPFFTN